MKVNQKSGASGERYQVNHHPARVVCAFMNFAEVAGVETIALAYHSNFAVNDGVIEVRRKPSLREANGRVAFPALLLPLLLGVHLRESESSALVSAAMTKQTDLGATKRLMAALGRMSPRPHDEMKLGKRTGKKTKSLRKHAASAKPKTA
jgi:hypothetical protein